MHTFSFATDELIQKKHENVKVLLRLKQNGAVIDTNSERSIQKVWPGVSFEQFAIGDKKIVYELEVGSVDEGADKGKKGGDKKGAKKEAKKE